MDLPSSQPRRRGFELTAAEWSSRASGGAERGAADLAVAELLRFGREERERSWGKKQDKRGVRHVGCTGTVIYEESSSRESVGLPLAILS